MKTTKFKQTLSTVANSLKKPVGVLLIPAATLYALLVAASVVASLFVAVGTTTVTPEKLDEKLKDDSSIQPEFNKCYYKTGTSLKNPVFYDFGKKGPLLGSILKGATLFQVDVSTRHDLGQFSQTDLAVIECGKLKPEFEMTANQAYTLLKQERDAFIKTATPKLKDLHRGLMPINTIN